MKKLLLLSIFIFQAFISLSQNGIWKLQSTGFTPALSGVKQIYVVDSNIVWMIAADNNGLPRNDLSITIDGGSHWVSSEVPAASGTFDWSSLAVIGDSIMWALLYNAVFGHGGELWHTTDAGANWVQQGSNTYISGQSLPNNIYFWNDSSGLMVGNQSNGEFECYNTIDSGNNWLAVAPANIPDPLNANENGWRTSHFQVIGDTVWFDTNEGRIFRSTDRGFHWTAANTNLVTAAAASINFCFTSGDYGIARLYDDATLLNTTVNTTDGGLTWNPISVSGNLFGGDIKKVPGSPMTMVSTGISTNSMYTGTSYSINGGLNWTTIETGTPRGTLGIADSLTMWCGGNTVSPTVGGVYKWTYYPSIVCNDPSITPGSVSVNSYEICIGDTLKITVSGGIGPAAGYYSGIGWIVTTADISGSTDPLNETSIVTTHPVTMPAPISHTQTFINDASFIDGINLPFGTYYWTPVFFSNAVNADSSRPVTNLGDLDLDPNCTFSGASTAIVIFAPGDSLCRVGISEIDRIHLSINSSMLDNKLLNVTINSSVNGKASIQVLDLTGRLIETVKTNINSGINNEVINVEKLATGTYLIKVLVNEYHAANKVVKF